MIDYRAGDWGLHVALGCHGSLAPRAITMAFPNAIITFALCYLLKNDSEDFDVKTHEDTTKAAMMLMSSFTVVMVFILYNRSRTCYSRWWEGGTLLQKARGEWFNAYSSIIAFTSTKPEMQEQVCSYTHLLARLMSLLMCCGLQQVSPYRDRPFEIIDLEGIEPESMDFLNAAPDKVEIILQWIQRSVVLNMQTGVLPVAPPILSRAFQEVSRGIVNLQNARKIADFPYPYPLAQVSMVLQLLHWAMTPVSAALALPRAYAVAYSFASIFVLWCIHFNALDLEFPFGTRVNDLPMDEMQQDWNKSIITLLAVRATRPPGFKYEANLHNDLDIVMSDASELYIPLESPARTGRRAIAQILISGKGKKLPAPPGWERPQSGMSLGPLASLGLRSGSAASNQSVAMIPSRTSCRKRDSVTRRASSLDGRDRDSLTRRNHGQDGRTQERESKPEVEIAVAEVGAELPTQDVSAEPKAQAVAPSTFGRKDGPDMHKENANPMPGIAAPCDVVLAEHAIPQKTQPLAVNGEAHVDLVVDIDAKPS